MHVIPRTWTVWNIHIAFFLGYLYLEFVQIPEKKGYVNVLNCPGPYVIRCARSLYIVVLVAKLLLSGSL